MNDLQIGFWDTEWSPHVSYTWTNRPKYLSNEMLVEEARLLCYGYKYRGKKTVVVDERAGRREMLESLRDFQDSVDVLVSFNGKSFDTKKVNSEFFREGIKPPSPFKEVDLYRDVIARKTAFYSGKLDFVAERIVGKKKVDTGGFQLWRDVLAGKEKAWAKFRRYQKMDVDLLEELFDELLPWIRLPHPVNEDGYTCHACGSHDLQRRGYQVTLTGKYQRFCCNQCGSWHRGTQRSSSSEFRAL